MTPTDGAHGSARGTDRAYVSNDSNHPITVIVSPSALEHLLAPGGTVIVEAVGPAHPGADLLVERTCDTAVVSTWAGAGARLLALDGSVLADEATSGMPSRPDGPGAAGANHSR